MTLVLTIAFVACLPIALASLTVMAFTLCYRCHDMVVNQTVPRPRQ